MKNYLLALLALLFVTHIPVSCNNSTEPRPSYEYQVESFLALCGTQTQDNVYSFQEIDFENQNVDSPVYDSSFCISLRVEKYKTLERLTALSKFSLINTATAKQEAAPEELANPTLNTKIELISIYPSDSLFINGSAYHNATSISNLFTIQTVNADNMTLTKFTETLQPWTVSEPFILKFNSTLDQDFTEKLRVKITMSDGYVMETDTKILKIKAQ